MTARVMVATALALQILTLSLTLATGGMRTEESSIFLFGHGIPTYPNPGPLMERIFICGRPAMEVWHDFKHGLLGPDLLAWFKANGATIVVKSADLKTCRTGEEGVPLGASSDREPGNTPPVKSVHGRMPELGLMEPIVIVLVLCALFSASKGLKGRGDKGDEVDIIWTAVKNTLTASIKAASMFVIHVEGDGTIAMNSLVRASQSQEIPLRRVDHKSPKVSNLAMSNLHSLGVLFRWYGWHKKLYDVRPSSKSILS